MTKMMGDITFFYERPKHSRPSREFWLGLDCGQAKDYSALAILSRSENRYGVVHLERLPLDMPYPEQIEHVYRLMHTRPLDVARKTLAVDYTGAGRPVVDLAQDRGLNPIGITITGGNASTWNEDRTRASVPKRDLVSILQVFAQDDRLKVAKALQAASIFAQELQDFKVKIDIRTAHDSYGAWREGAHDDLILAVAIALWTAENQTGRQEMAISRYIDTISFGAF